ncbi:MAG: hypothetical protein U0L20_07415 [Ruminococcus sp.]|nr:hypothetical protein [Ruminococcus sp.]
MEIAVWKEQLIYASKIKESYDLEKAIREASTKDELRCFDKECDSPIIKYCHGNIKRPYFAHKHKCNCDYAKYDNNNSLSINNIKVLIFEHLNRIGIKADIDKKIIEHHYTHIFISTNSIQLAIELVTDSALSIKINKLSDQYKKHNIRVQFIVIGENYLPKNESDNNFIRRFSFNETTNNNLLVINEQGSGVYQYRHRPLKGTNYQTIFSATSNIYHEKDVLNNLTFENGYLTIRGFNDRYNSWLSDNQNIKQKILTAQHTFSSSKSKTETNLQSKNNISSKEIAICNNNKAVKTYKTNQIKTIDELKFIEDISLPPTHIKTVLYDWSEGDFIDIIEKVCYESNTNSFKKLIAKIKSTNNEEKIIINKLWENYRITRIDYFHILKTAFEKSGIKRNK